MRNSFLRKLNNATRALIIFVIMVCAMSFTSLASISYASDTSIRPSATRSSKVPEIVVDKDNPPESPYDIRDGNEDKVKLFVTLDLISYYDSQQEDYSDSDVKISMQESWTDISSKSVSALNTGLTDDLAKTLGKNESYTKANYEITYFFNMSIGSDAIAKINEAPENHLTVTFILHEIKPTDSAPLVLYRCATTGSATADSDTNGWNLITDAKNNGDYTITVKFYDLIDENTSILFISTKDVTPTPIPDDDESESKFPVWLIIVIIASALVVTAIVAKVFNSKNGGGSSGGSNPNNFKTVRH